MVKACPTLLPHVYDFLENKAYNKGKGDFARKVSESQTPPRGCGGCCADMFVFSDRLRFV